MSLIGKSAAERRQLRTDIIETLALLFVLIMLILLFMGVFDDQEYKDSLKEDQVTEQCEVRPPFEIGTCVCKHPEVDEVWNGCIKCAKSIEISK